MKLLICGKGGCGKSTVSALIAKGMRQRGKEILVVDADESNIGLYRMLGVTRPEPLMDHLGGKKGLREKSKPAGISLGGTPQLFPTDLYFTDLPEAYTAVLDGIRVLSVGKIHHFGEGCACPMGSLFRMLFASLRLRKEEMVIVDTAAGVEHFGRSLDGQCDHILCVADPSYESLMMVKRVEKLGKEAGLPVSVLINKVTPEIEAAVYEALKGSALVGHLPESRAIFLNNFKGEALDLQLPELEKILDGLSLGQSD